MDKYKLFREHIKESAREFNKVCKREVVRIISHLDCDGICACSILIKLLKEENRRFSISIIQQLNEEKIKELSNEKYRIFIFTDLGSSYFTQIKTLLRDKTFFVLDHHEIEDKTINSYHVNPNLFGIDGGKEISGAGVVYLFCSELNKNVEKKMAHIAVVGAIGDVQDRDCFKKLNKDILDIAILNEKIKVKKGLRIFGAQTKPIHKVLEYCTDPFIPGVTGSESGAIQFLNHIGINPKTENGWKKMVHLTEDEMKGLIAAIVLRRSSQKEPEDVISDTYILTEEENESPLKDAKEFSTLLNSCGRLNKASLGIGVCLGNKESKHKAIKNLNDYKREIIKALEWYNENRDSSDIIREESYIIINAKDNMLSTIAGTIASILSRSNDITENTYIMSLARADENLTKVSLRIAGNNNKDMDLRQIITEIVKKAGYGDAGGHPQAAGAMIPSGNEKEFINIAKDVLKSAR